MECFLSCTHPLTSLAQAYCSPSQHPLGCPKRMPQGNEQQTLPWEAASSPFPTPAPNLTAKRAIPCSTCANPLPAHGEAQLWGKGPVWSGREVHFPALERPSIDSFTSCGMKEGRSIAARASSPCMLYLWKLGAGQQA